jgi:hypothetical protein
MVIITLDKQISGMLWNLSRYSTVEYDGLYIMSRYTCDYSQLEHQNELVDLLGHYL